ncbi:MAG: SoxR reducing system RseC family protein [Desulfobacterales bacterium]|nr:SoxR reducing system RseC family protein [Desulfobacterales bacterium]
MITENGIVTRATSDTAWIKTIRSAACESCSSKDSCGTGHHGSQEMNVAVKNTLGVEKGDPVVIGIESKPMIYLSFLLYVFPIILLVIGAVIGDSIAPSLHMDESASAMVVGFLFFGAAFLVVRKKQAAMSGKDEYKPFLVRKKSRSAIDSCSIL